jgi:hypothetical protein
LIVAMRPRPRRFVTPIGMTGYRRVRAQMGRGIVPLAMSVDGFSFTFQAALHQLRLRRGGYVVLEADGQARLGQITSSPPGPLIRSG